MIQRQIVRAGRRAMACQFEVLLPSDSAADLQQATIALDLVDTVEDQLSVYRRESELSRLNRTAADQACRTTDRLFGLLEQCASFHRRTSGAFDVTIGPLLRCWGFLRRRGRFPSREELDENLAMVGMPLVRLDQVARTVAFAREGVEINLGAIGKGFALDVAMEHLRESGLSDVLLHGGYSSMLGKGSLAGEDGWPVGIRHPLRPGKRLATLNLRDGALATSGSGEQFFRHEGRRYSHLLDPRTGRPVEGMLSVTALAPSAAEADALATAFFVLGVEKTCEYCENQASIGALLVPEPKRGGALEVVKVGAAVQEARLMETGQSAAS